MPDRQTEDAPSWRTALSFTLAAIAVVAVWGAALWVLSVLE